MSLALAVGLMAHPLLAQPSDPAPKAAPTKPRVFVFPLVKGDAVSDLVFNKVERDFQSLFKLSNKFEVVTDAQVKQAEEEKAAQERRTNTVQIPEWLEQANALLWQGKDLLVKKDFAKAIEVLTQAREIYEEHRMELREYDSYVDATLQLAIAFYEAGYKDNGDELLKDVLIWRPDLVVDKKKYPQSFVKAFDEHKGLLEKRKGGTIRVEAVPADGAMVYVDGRLRGTLSKDKPGIDIEGLYRGRHYVQVMLENHEIFAKETGVPEVGRSEKIVANLNPIKKKETGPASAAVEGASFKVYQYALTGDFDVAFSRDASKFAEQAQVGYLLFGYVSKEPRGVKLTLFLFKADWSALAEVDPVVFDDNLTNLQVNLLFLEANLSEALQTFPKNKLVRGKPAVYVKVEKPIEKPIEKPVETNNGSTTGVVGVGVVDPTKTGTGTGGTTGGTVGSTGGTTGGTVGSTGGTTGGATGGTTVVVTPGNTGGTGSLLPPRTGGNDYGTTSGTGTEDLGELSSIFAGGGNSGPTYGNNTVIPGGEDDDSITGKWWFWTGVAVGAGLLGGGSWFLIDSLGSSDPSKYKASVTW